MGPDSLNKTTCNKWIAAIQGPNVTRTGINDEQREMVIHLLLTLWAYSQARDDVDIDGYYSVVGELVVLAMSCGPYERTDGQLAKWLSEATYGALPAVCLHPTLCLLPREH